MGSAELQTDLSVAKCIIQLDENKNWDSTGLLKNWNSTGLLKPKASTGGMIGKRI